MKHATHMATPVGAIAISESIAETFKYMSDREIADKALKSGPFIDPEYYAELLHRGLSGPGMYTEDTYRLIEQREQAAK